MFAGDHWRLDTELRIFDGQTESQFLAKSGCDVAKHYGGGVLDQKTVDWCMLIQALAIVYGSRIMMSRMARKAAPPKPQVFTPDPPRPQKGNGASPPSDAGTVTIAGIGSIELPDDHPLNPNYKPH